ncbi:MAG: NfeD family protein [Planctomycetia bacterium]|nr:NfeD family protein [Planctomycetia bacterium]
MKRPVADESINLHGLAPDVALLRVRNKCQEPGMKGHTLLVIHGYGQGILRERVRNWGQSSLLVKTMWPGEQYNLPGGGGVTLFFLSLLFCLMACLVDCVIATSETPAAETSDTIAAAETKSPVFLIEIPLPVTAECNANLRRSLASAFDRDFKEKEHASNVDPVIVFRFRTAPGEEEHAKTTLFGDAFELARFLRGKQFAPGGKNSFRTIAWISGPLAGHALLPALACDELIVGAECALGPASLNDSLPTEAERSAYREMTTKKGCESLLDAWLNPALKLYEYESDTGHGFLVGDSLAAATPQGMAFLTEPVEYAYPLGRGVFAGAELRRVGLVDRTLDTSGDEESLADFVAAVPGVDGQVTRVPLLATVRPGVIRIFGTLGPAMMAQIQRKILDAFETSQVNCLILEIESPGGSLTDALNLGNYLVNEIDHGTVRVIGYVPNEARGDAAILALSCDELYVGEHAILGGAGAAVPDPTELEAASRTIAESWAPRSGRNPSLATAMLSSRSPLRQYRNRVSGKVDWFTESLYQQAGDRDQWQPGEVVVGQGYLFQTKGKEAVTFRMAEGTVRSFSELCSVCGIGKEPLVVQPHWVDVFLQGLASPLWSGILLSLAFALLYIEANSPGLGFAGMFAALFLILFFWANLLGGTAGWLEVLLLLFGAILVLLEIFVIPGFGLTGVLGGACMLIALVLATQTFVIPRNFYQWEQFRNSLLMLCIVGVGTLAVAVTGFRTLLTRFSLPPGEPTSPQSSQEERLTPGQRGRTTSPCLPAGKARFGDNWVSVLAEDAVPVPADTPVEIVRISGNQITVRPVKPW